MFPLHPLTVEDVLQQDPREKVDNFDSLGYYFIVVRALDERYFRYTSESAASSAEGVSVSQESSSADSDAKVKFASDEFEMTELRGESAGISETTKLEGKSQVKKPRVDMIEGLDGKEGVEGVSVGAVNLYLVVFAHGVISVSTLARAAVQTRL